MSAPKPLEFDERIALLVAFSTIGTIILASFTSREQGFNLAGIQSPSPYTQPTVISSRRPNETSAAQKPQSSSDQATVTSTAGSNQSSAARKPESASDKLTTSPTTQTDKYFNVVAPIPIGSGLGKPTATPSSTPTQSPAAGAVASPTPTLSPTPGTVVSPLPTLSPTPGAVVSPTPTISPTPGAVVSPTPTISPTPGAVASPTPTLSPIPGVVVLPTPTLSPTPGAVASSSPTPTEPRSVPLVPLPIQPAPPKVAEQQLEFSDVPKDYWAHGFIIVIAKRGIVNGFPDGTFGPEKPVTRAEFATMMKKTFAAKKTRDRLEFVDVPSDYWAAEEIDESTQTAFLRGYPQQIFKPAQQIPRVQVLAALASGLGLKPKSDPAKILQNYKDADRIPKWAIEQVAAATEIGLVFSNPDPTLLNPNQAATRADIADLIHEALVIAGKAERIRAQ